MTALDRPGTAALDDPLYYQRNLLTVLRWVAAQHRSQLLPEETACLTSLLTLPIASQALLARMVMRKGEVFRLETLAYAEIGDTATALAPLLDSSLASADPEISAADLCRLCRHRELAAAMATLLPDSTLLRSASKAQLREALLKSDVAEHRLPLSRWYASAGFELVSLNCRPLLERIRLMFFGNLHQDWTEFVLTELGHQQFEPIDFPVDSKPFQNRAEVDSYLRIHACQQQLTEGQALNLILASLPSPETNSWLEHRRQRLLLAVARHAERLGQHVEASRLYQANPLAEATVRYFRLQEKRFPPDDYFPDLCTALRATPPPLYRVHLQRLHRRAARKLGQATRHPPAMDIPAQTLQLTPADDERVEQSVIRHLEGPAFHVENSLFTGLLGLLLWPALFEPLPGAFFHPFQAGPADLFRADFYPRRQQLIEGQLASLQCGNYAQLIRQRAREKRAIACSLVNWSVLSEELLELSLNRIPPTSLEKIFRHLLSDLRHHRSGLPDLIHFPVDGGVELIEVKGPGDRLQDHQRLWLEFLRREQIPVWVANVSWGSDPC